MIKISAWAELEGREYEEEIELDPGQEKEYKRRSKRKRLRFIQHIVREWALERFSFGFAQVNDNEKVSTMRELYDAQEKDH